MAALTQPRETVQMGVETVLPTVLEFPVAAGQHHWPGAIVATNAAGLTVVPTEALNLVAQGMCIKEADNTLGADGAIKCKIKVGTFLYFMGGGADVIHMADRGNIVFLIDDQTVGATDNNGARSPAGYVVDVQGNQVVVAVGQPSLNDVAPTQSGLQSVTLCNTNTPPGAASPNPVQSTGVSFTNLMTVSGVQFNGSSTMFFVSLSLQDSHATENWSTSLILNISGAPGSPYQVGSFGDSVTQTERSQSFQIAINDIPAGSATVQLQFNQTLGTGPLQFTNGDWLSVSFIEL